MMILNLVTKILSMKILITLILISLLVTTKAFNLLLMTSLIYILLLVMRFSLVMLLLMLLLLMTSYLKKIMNGKALFKKAFIPLNARATSNKPECPTNSNGIPVCPLDHSLPMIFNGHCHEKR